MESLERKVGHIPAVIVNFDEGREQRHDEENRTNDQQVPSLVRWILTQDQGKVTEIVEEPIKAESKTPWTRYLTNTLLALSAAAAVITTSASIYYNADKQAVRAVLTNGKYAGKPETLTPAFAAEQRRSESYLANLFPEQIDAERRAMLTSGDASLAYRDPTSPQVKEADAGLAQLALYQVTKLAEHENTTTKEVIPYVIAAAFYAEKAGRQDLVQAVAGTVKQDKPVFYFVRKELEAYQATQQPVKLAAVKRKRHH